MIAKFVATCLHRRWLVLAIFGLIAVFGYYSWTELSLEAYPDIADTTAQVVTQFPGHAAEEIEEQVTIPLERELNGLPGLHVMRSKSTFGLSLITLVFRDGIEDYWARQRIQERIGNVDLPPGASPGLDPLTSPIGEIYRYTLESQLAQRARAEGAAGVGGHPDAEAGVRRGRRDQLRRRDDAISSCCSIRRGSSSSSSRLHNVIDAIQTNNANAGG